MCIQKFLIFRLSGLGCYKFATVYLYRFDANKFNYRYNISAQDNRMYCINKTHYALHQYVY